MWLAYIFTYKYMYVLVCTEYTHTSRMHARHRKAIYRVYYNNCLFLYIFVISKLAMPLIFFIGIRMKTITKFHHGR